ncbi:hypothetical protein [Candidatus Similichlamydia laticola]|uniref:Uncharacterized protein n=1 Tax=Candidatus Similichlamydia laticola TaxID=2170265 RepID=A0A369KAD6_9BACT|nr:hypothetical protein [Candidatus Similichlamydia laticola]RDB31559.1 hypothetical protein HAT2_00362 [Candidatus Similichlamydia laticola]
MTTPSIPVSAHTNNASFTYLRRAVQFAHCQSVHLIRVGQKVAYIGKEVIKPAEQMIRQGQVVLKQLKLHQYTEPLMRGSHFVLLLPSVAEFGTIGVSTWKKANLVAKINDWRKQLSREMDESSRKTLSLKIQEGLKDLRDSYSKTNLLHLFASMADIVNNLVTIVQKLGKAIPIFGSFVAEIIAASLQLALRLGDLARSLLYKAGKTAVLVAFSDVCISILKVIKPVVLVILTFAGFLSPHVLLAFTLISCVMGLLRCLKASFALGAESCITGSMKLELALKWLAWIFSLVVGVTGLVDAFVFLDGSLDKTMLIMNSILFLVHIPILALGIHNNLEKRRIT